MVEEVGEMKGRGKSRSYLLSHSLEASMGELA